MFDEQEDNDTLVPAVAAELVVEDIQKLPVTFGEQVGNDMMVSAVATDLDAEEHTLK